MWRIAWFKIFIMFSLLVSLSFLGLNIWAMVETSSSLIQYLKGEICPAFIDVNDLTMKDECTGMVWARHELPTYHDDEVGYNYNEAENGCADLEPGEMFRLPTVEELLTLIKYACDTNNCSASLALLPGDENPFFASGIYWTISDFNEPAIWKDSNAVPPGNLQRDYNRSVNLLKGIADSPIFNKQMKLNAWCLVNRTPEIIEKKFTVATTSSVPNGTQATGGTLRIAHNRLCIDNFDCNVLAGTFCDAGLASKTKGYCVKELSVNFITPRIVGCNSGYHVENNACVANGSNWYGGKFNGINVSIVTYSCTSPPSNATLCSAGADNTIATLASACDGTTKCQYTCNLGYNLLGGSCLVVTIIYSCTGVDPANATLCTGDNTGLTANTTKTPVSSCSTPAGSNPKCEYTCNSGYTLSGGNCVAITYSCTGATPANAILCTGDNTDLTANTAKTAVDYCTTGKKCEYQCNANYALVGTSCVAGKLVFVTWETWNGNLGGVAGATAKCTNEATTKGLLGTFKAWLSTSTANDPQSTFTQSTTIPYYLISGDKIADSWADLTDGILDHAINVDIDGVATTVAIWTNTNFDGTAVNVVNLTNYCQGYINASSSNSGRTGLSSVNANTTWTNKTATACNLSARLYCFGQ